MTDFERLICEIKESGCDIHSYAQMIERMIEKEYKKEADQFVSLLSKEVLELGRLVSELKESI